MLHTHPRDGTSIMYVPSVDTILGIAQNLYKVYCCQIFFLLEELPNYTSFCGEVLHIDCKQEKMDYFFLSLVQSLTAQKLQVSHTPYINLSDCL